MKSGEEWCDLVSCNIFIAQTVPRPRFLSVHTGALYQLRSI
jgi:hypothetical protein